MRKEYIYVVKGTTKIFSLNILLGKLLNLFFPRSCGILRWSILAPLINCFLCFLISRSSSPQTTNSEPSSPDSQKTPLIICNLNISADVKTLAPKNLKRSAKKLPPFCVQYQNTLSKNSAVQESNMKTINDFIVQGTLIANHRRRARQRSHAAHHDSPDIIINCEDDECDECNTSDIAMNVFNNINTDLLLSLDCYEMDSFGRLPGDSRTPTPIPILSPNPMASGSGALVGPTQTLLAVPAGYRPLSLRTPSPNTRSIIRIDVVNRDKIKTEPNIKDINYNVNRLKEKRGVREKSDKQP